MAFGRELNFCQHRYSKHHSCYVCGLYQHQNAAIKSVAYVHPSHINPKHYLAHLRKRSSKIVTPNQLNESTFILLTQICQKFSYGLQTLSLGIYFYQSLKEMSTYEKFWASCCLMIASKGIQLDKNVPYLNRFQRYADKDHSQQEYEMAQRNIFQALNFDVQYSTFMTFINFYLTQGIIFQKDQLNKSLVQYLEDDVILRAKQYLRKGNFTKYQPEKLALSIIKQIRKKYNLSEWTAQIQLISGLKLEQLSDVEDEKALKHKKIEVNQLKSHKVIDMKNICIRKKLDQISISCTKTIIGKSTRPNSSIKQNSLSTYQQSLISNKNKSNVLLAPLNSQFSSLSGINSYNLNNPNIYNLATRRR